MQHDLNLVMISEAGEQARGLAPLPENRRNSTGTFEGGKQAGLEQVLRLLLEIDPEAAAGTEPLLSDASYGPPE